MVAKPFSLSRHWLLASSSSSDTQSGSSEPTLPPVEDVTSSSSSSDAMLPPAVNVDDGDDDSVKLTESCIEQLRKVTSAEERYLRVSVEGGGCSGFQYKFELEKSVDAEEDVIISGGDRAHVVVDTESLEFLKGATIDFQRELIRSSFVVLANPKADKGCSCGASFSIKL